MEAIAFVPQEQRSARQFAEMKDLQDKQIKVANGETEAETIPANKDANIKIKASDKDYVHIAAVTRNLAPDQKSFFDESRVIKVHANQFNQLVNSNAFAAYDDVKVIHDPRPNAPKEYALKPLQPGQTPPVDMAAIKANDAALAAREQKVKDLEKSLDKKIAELNRLQEETGKAKLTGAAKTAADKKAAEEKAAADKVAGAQTGEQLPPPPTGEVK